MRFNKLDLNLLVALDALLELRSITRAAEKLCLSQSAMSNALARLREYLDDELLVQVGRRMELTPRAESLRDAVRDVLVRIDATIAAQPTFEPRESSREFRIVVSDYTLSILAAYVLQVAYAQSRSVRFHFLPQVEHPHRMLERGEADLLIIPSVYASREHPNETLLTESFCAVVSADSPHAGRPLGLPTYLDAGHAVMVPAAGHRSLETVLLSDLGIERRVEVSSFHFSSLPQLLVGTDRIATIHRRLASQLQRHYPVRMLELPVQLPSMDQRLQWHAHKSRDPGLMWLREVFHKAVRVMDSAYPDGLPPGSGS